MENLQMIPHNRVVFFFPSPRLKYKIRENETKDKSPELCTRLHYCLSYLILILYKGKTIR
ncbi:hypothetical protein PUN28_018025 [Cardiocondyla obscurior]|uniref:Uncharacterized protein n=1 Tax=Cardiocondyla obscurior TaxID=286306 RepID=A0AAW2EGZ9_9HYME